MYRLRELEQRDLPTVNRWRNDPELVGFLGAPFRYINLETDQRWYEGYMKSRHNTVRCSIVNERDEVLGLVSLTNIDYMNQSAEFHIMIGDEGNRGKGVGTFAVTAMLAHAFDHMNLHRVELTVLSDNARAKRLYERCGFVKEGVKRAARFKKGRFVDMELWAILRDDSHV